MKRFLLFFLLALTIGSVGAWAETFKLVTSQSEIEVGGEYIVVHKEKSWAMGSQNGNFRNYVLISITNDEIEITDQAVSIVTIEESGNADFPYMLSVVDNGTKAYLYNGGSTSNYLKTVTSKTTATAYSNISLKTDGSTIIKFNKQNSKKVNFQLQANQTSGTERFACYAATQEDCYLYKKQTVKLPEPSLSFNQSTYELTEGEEMTVTVQGAPDGASVSYTSLNPDLATVDAEGKVKALKPGEVTITATSSETSEYAEGSASYVLTIKKQPVDVSPIFAPASVEIKTNGEFTVTPEDFFTGVRNLAISTESDCLTILGEGDTWMFEAEAVGTATVSVSWEAGSLYKAGSTSFEFTVTPLGKLDAPVFNPENGEFPLGEIITITGPVGSKIFYGEGTSADDATIEDNEFMLEALGEHTFVAYAYDEENARKSDIVTATYTVVKSAPEFGFAESTYSVQMGGEPQALNNPANIAYTLTSSNPEVAIVSPVDGQSVWMLQPGTATITATAAETESTAAATASYELTVMREVGELVPSELEVTFDFTTETPYGISPLSGNANTYNFTANKKVTEGEVSLTSGGNNRVWSGSNGNELRVMSGKTITIAVPDGCSINYIRFYKGPGGTFAGTGLTEVKNGTATLYYEWKPVSKFTSFTYTSTGKRSDIATIEVNYEGMVESAPAHSSVNLTFDGDREALVDEITAIDPATVAADADVEIVYAVVDGDGNESEDAIVEVDEEGVLNIYSEVRGEYRLMAYVAPSEAYYPAVVYTPLYVRNVICPEHLYMHGHYWNRYYDLSRPVELTREEGTKLFTVNGVLIGSNSDVTDGDLGYLFTTHLPATADAPAAAPARAAAHQSNWADLTEGYVFDKDGGYKNASDVTAQEHVTPFTVEKEGFYNVTVDMSNAEQPVVTHKFTGAVVGVESVTVADDAVATYYDLQGNRVANPTRGLYIRVAGGKAEKVMMQ